MLNQKIFKAYDVRGRYPDEINEKAVLKICASLGTYFKKGAVVVGHDARLSSPSLYRAALQGIKQTRKDGKFFEVGFVTTPMLYFLVNHLKAAGGIMVTASHNPKEFNGLKIMGPKADPISGTDLLKHLKM